MYLSLKSKYAEWNSRRELYSDKMKPEALSRRFQPL
jgi:hypothetical protein